ncbi:hypothetical protein [Paracoccus sp. S1E-3]|uniref:hypothetical protein n=1 Tax=Paracoccus sp. S1E-3 TaxID=2756130 RepID=UPI0015EE9A28|nr:hypothetical protein [Paracoccus sp. S1E-3]MBA4492287.1 hypothetical protein [Paracoccus sp. S1E-3]
MPEEINPLATHYLPSFITAPGQVDGLLVGIGIFLLVVVFLLGVAFLWLHSLPERLAHHGQKLQFEIVAVLCLLALFTHNNLLWGAALILAMIDLPDLTTPLTRISEALERMTGTRVRVPAVEPAPVPDAPSPAVETPAQPDAQPSSAEIFAAETAPAKEH